MKSKNILIISPNLEPKRCGVSDFISILEYELKRKYKFGLNIFKLSLHDRYVKQIVESSNSVRIPSVFSKKQKKASLKKVIKELQPKEVIFNYVGYGYHSKGIPLYLISCVKLFENYVSDIFLLVHELSTGNFSEEPIKNKLLGYWQNAFFKRLVRVLKPRKIYCTTQAVEFLLNKININATCVPVFSNIQPIVTDSIDKSVSPKLFAIDFQRNDTLFLCFFGSIQNHIDFKLFYQILKNQVVLSEKSIMIFSVGNLNMPHPVWSEFESWNIPNVSFKRLGELSSLEVSYLLQRVDYGISAYIATLWSKSGALAAMLAHRLPVLTIGNMTSLDGMRENIEINPMIQEIQCLPKGFVFKKRLNIEIDICYNTKIFEKYNFD